MPLLFALLCFAIAVPALLVAFAAAHVWLAATIVSRLSAGRYVRAALWGGVLAALLALDCQLAASPADAHYALPSDYLDAAAAVVREAAPASACELHIELTGQLLHVVAKNCAAQLDDDFHVNDRHPKCTTQLTGIAQTDRVTWLIWFIDSGQDCESYSKRALQFQLVGGDTLEITNTENY